MNVQQKVGVLGGGSWGTTLSHILGENGHRVFLWLRDNSIREEINKNRTNCKYLPGHRLSNNICAVEELERVAKECEVIILATPALAFRKIAYELGNFVKGDHILISATKGLDPDTHAIMSRVLREETCCRKIGAISGPNLSEEIMRGYPTATIIASRFHEVFQRVSMLITSPRFRVYTSEDIIGVELGGALKNIIAIAAGIMNGVGFGDNTKAFLVSRGLVEITRLGTTLGANPLTFTGLAGIGDLMVTCASPLSRNNQVGYRLGAGETLREITSNMFMVAEGIYTTKATYEHAKEKGIDMPITEGVYKILYENFSIKEAIESLMSIKTEYEFVNTQLSTDSDRT